MYRGDGSYKPEFDIEVSFLDLLKEEKDAVDGYNSAVNAYHLAKKNRLSTMHYKDSINKSKTKLNSIRSKIKQHCDTKLGIKTNISDILYNNE